MTKRKRKVQSEKIIQANIVAWLRSNGISCDVITLNAYNSGGISDIVGCLPDGKFLSIEVKRPKVGKLTKLQEKWIEEKLKSNAVSIVAHSVDEVQQLLKGYGY